MGPVSSKYTKVHAAIVSEKNGGTISASVGGLLGCTLARVLLGSILSARVGQCT